MFKTWKNRDYKIEIHFSDDLIYTAYSDDSNRRVKDLSWNETEGNTTSNILGITESNRGTVTLFDINDYLSPNNSNSPYKEYLKTGKKVNVYKEKEDGTYEKDRDYYITSIAGSFAEGIPGTVSFGLADRYNLICNTAITGLDIFVNVPISELIYKVFELVGVSADEIYFDSRLDKDIPYGVVYGQTIKEFINGACQILMARCTVDKNNRFIFIPALARYENSKEWEVTEELIEEGLADIQSLKNSLNTSMNYSKVKLIYDLAGNEIGAQIKSLNQTIVTGYNKFVIPFDSRALEINEIKIKSKEAGTISNIEYVAYQDAIEITCYSLTDNIANFIINGTIIATTETYEERQLDNDLYNNSYFTFRSKIIMTEEKARETIASLADYISKMKHTISISLKITDEVSVGDILILNIENDTYRGIYKIIDVKGKAGNPILNLTCVLEENIAYNRWNDNDFWNDDEAWED